MKLPHPDYLTEIKKISSVLGNSSHAKKSIPMTEDSQNHVLSTKGNMQVVNLKKLNQNIPYVHFRLEGLSLLKELLQKGDFLWKLDLQDAFFQ